MDFGLGIPKRCTVKAVANFMVWDGLVWCEDTFYYKYAVEVFANFMVWDGLVWGHLNNALLKLSQISWSGMDWFEEA